MKEAGILKSRVFRFHAAPLFCFQLILIASTLLAEAFISKSNVPAESAQGEERRAGSKPGRSTTGCPAGVVESLNRAVAAGDPGRTRRVLSHVLDCRQLDPDFLLRLGSEV